MVNEFSMKPLDKLYKSKISLLAYKQGCEDTFNIISDTHKKTMQFYEEKLKLCQTEIDKLENKNADA